MGKPTKLAVVFCSLLCAVMAIPGQPSTDPDEYDLRRRNPAGCEPGSCTYFVGLRRNENDSNFLDVYLEGDATGWLAVGFSKSNSMQDSDVVGCVVDEGSTVTAIDTYNVVGARNNMLDGTQEQEDIVQGTGDIVDGRITCTFSRRIQGQEAPPMDQNLDDEFFFLFGFGNSPGRGGGGGFTQHQSTPMILGGDVNPVMFMEELLPPEATTRLPAPATQPGDYRLRRADPPGCDPDSCDFFMGINTNSDNSSFLDFYLTAEVEGWVAVGFSSSANMLDADVVGCNHDGSGTVFAVDTYNPPGDRVNVADDNANPTDVVMHSGSFENGRITCVFSRSIAGIDAAPQDRPLDSNYFLLFGVGDSGGGLGAFRNHLPLIPLISDGQFNPLTSAGEVGVSRFRQQLLQAHGILMLLAWPVLAFTAIFFAAWMKQALPNGEWFQVHRAFHIAALFVALIGFILAFVANRGNNGLITLGSQNKSGTAHFVLGIIIMALQIANPLIALFRCKPNGQYRWIFNLIHGFLIGLGVEFLAYANIGIGVSIFSESQSDFGDLTILWVYLAFVVFAVVLNSGLLLFFSCEAGIKGEEGTKLAPAVTKPFFNKASGGGGGGGGNQGVEMTKPGEPQEPAGPPPRKPPSEDAPIRWIALGLFLGVMLPLIFAVIVMIAATGNTD